MDVEEMLDFGIEKHLAWIPSFLNADSISGCQHCLSFLLSFFVELFELEEDLWSPSGPTPLR